MDRALQNVLKTGKSKSYIFCIIACFIYLAFMVYIYRFIGIDWDKSSHLLQAQDVLSGNIFFRDWNLTGVTFLTTDLLFYEIGYLLFGVSRKAIFTSGGLMTGTALLISFFASNIGKKDHRLLRKIIFAGLTMLPGYYFMETFRTHGAAVSYCLVSFLLTYATIHTETDNKRRMKTLYILIIIVQTLGIFGDMLVLVGSSIPILLYCIIRIVQKNSSENRKFVSLSAICLFSALISMLFDKLYFIVGGAYKNSRIVYTYFRPYSEWGKRLSELVHVLLQLSESDFSDSSLFKSSSLLKLPIFAILIVSCIWMVLIIIALIKNEPVDDLSVLLTISSLTVFCVNLFTSMSGRKYITIIPIAMVLIFTRNIESIYKSVYNTKFLTILLLAFPFLCLTGRAYDTSQLEYPDYSAQQDLIDFLKKNNLNYGYGCFWNSPDLTVYSQASVKVRHIIKKDRGYYIDDWFSKNSWYHEPAQFVLLQAPGETGIEALGKEQDVIDFFGEPDNRYEVRYYTILAYNKDLSKILGQKKNFGEDGIISANEIFRYHNENVTYSDSDEVILSSGGATYGPYDTLAPGKYIITFEGNMLKDAVAEIWSSYDFDPSDYLGRTDHYYHESHLSYSEIDHTDTVISFDVELTDTISDIEYRISNDSEHDIVLKNIIIDQQ